MRFGNQDGKSDVQAPDYKVLLPRLGFAWSPVKNWVVRGGAGIYDYGWSIDSYAGGAEGVGNNSHGSLTQTNNVAPVFVLGQATYGSLNYTGPNLSPSSYNGQSVTYYPYHTPVARNYQWSLSLEHQFGNGFFVQTAYVASHSTALSFPIDLNQIPPNLLAASVTTKNNQALRPYPQYSSISANLYNGISNYNSAQVTVTKRMSYGLQFDLNYTWSHMLDDQDRPVGVAMTVGRYTRLLIIQALITDRLTLIFHRCLRVTSAINCPSAKVVLS